MGNADTGKEEDTSEEDTKNAEKYSLLYKFPRVPFARAHLDVFSSRTTPQTGSLGIVLPFITYSHEYI